MPEISVIIPVYNVKDYLDECMESVLGQTFRDIEILLIDDGSKDGSGAMCDEYAVRDGRIRVVHQQNAGLSAVLNRGMEMAEGRYFAFIDSDDYAAPDMLEALHRTAAENDADVAVCGIYRVKGEKIIPPAEQTRYTTDGRSFFKEILIGEQINVTKCDKLFRRECFDKVRFPEGKVTEDGYTAVDLYPPLARVAVDLAPKYYYRLREDGITFGRFSRRDYDAVDAYTRCLSIAREKYPECAEAAVMRYLRSYFILYDKMIVSGGATREEQRAVLHVLRGRRRDILQNPYIYRTRKIGFLMMCVSSGLYRRFVLWYTKKQNSGD